MEPIFLDRTISVNGFNIKYQSFVKKKTLNFCQSFEEYNCNLWISIEIYVVFHDRS